MSSIPLCVCLSRLLYPFICWYALRLLPCLDNCKWCCYEYRGMCIFSKVFTFLDVYPGVEFLGHMVFYFQGFFFEKASFCFLQWLQQLTFPPTIHKGSLFSTSLSTFVTCVLFDNSCSDSCEVISHCIFNLHFSDD